MFYKKLFSRAFVSWFVLNTSFPICAMDDNKNKKISKHFDRINNEKSDFLVPYPVLKNYGAEKKQNSEFNKEETKEKIIKYLKDKGFELNIDSSEEEEYFNTEIETRCPIEPLTWQKSHPFNVAKTFLTNKPEAVRLWCGEYYQNNILEENKELFKSFKFLNPPLLQIEKVDTETMVKIYKSILVYLYTISRFQNEICNSSYILKHGFGLIKCLLNRFFGTGGIYGYNNSNCTDDNIVVYRSACKFLGIQGSLCIDMVYGYDKLKKFDLRFKIASQRIRSK